ncbi:MAG: transaldolase family protein [Oligoflexus sp.]
MTSPLQSLVASGTKLWIDSIDPDLVLANQKLGATGATSNPIIVSDILKTGRYDAEISKLKEAGHPTNDVAWLLTDRLVSQAEEVFLPVFEKTKGNDGYVSFEVDPLLEDVQLAPPLDQRVEQYVELGKKWAKDHPNRLIKVPATEAGLNALEVLVAAGVNVNVTLIFSQRQYAQARDAVWRGAQKRSSLDQFKSVFSIFVSRLDVYAEQKVPGLSAEAKGQVGILNAKRVWQENQKFWADKKTPLQQEMIFASTGTKKPEDPKWKYVQAFAGSDIETNPPETNDAVEASGLTFNRHIDQMPPATLVAEIDEKLDWNDLERTLMQEGLAKFAEPQKKLLALIESV